MGKGMKITVLPGDGIGPEVTREAIGLMTEVASAFGLEIEVEEHLVGGIAIEETGSPFPDETKTSCLNSDAVFLGAVGSPEYDDLPPEQRPEKGLLELRMALGGYANLRPSKAVPALIDASPLRREIFAGTDLLIVRELLGGLYFGTPRGFEQDRSGGYNTMRYSVEEIERVARVAFESARGRRKKVTSVDKANVLETSQVWRETVARVGADYGDVQLEHLFVDACAMHLVTAPTQFDVILTENLFGDILSDEAAVLTGSLGMLASATIGSDIGLYEPVHGSAPQIAGRNIANPLGAIASAAMLLRYSARNEAAAAAVEDAIETTLEQGYRTVDLAVDGYPKIVSTTEMGRLVRERAAENANGKPASRAA